MTAAKPREWDEYVNRVEAGLSQEEREILDAFRDHYAAHRREKALAMLREHAASLDPDSFVSEVIRVLEGEDEAPTAAQVPERVRQRIFRVPIDQGIPEGWRFAQWLGKETIMFAPYWADVVLCEEVDE